MGKDNPFHKRRRKDEKGLKRRKASRKPYDKVLIVCEGEKTEPQYFNGLINHHRISSANVLIYGDGASDPMGIYRYARRLYEEEEERGDPFDRVYCVFDKDSHHSYMIALATIGHAKPKSTFVATYSVPCFEYWLLLHFNYTTRPYGPLSGKSACDQVIAELKTYYRAYTKGDDNIFPRFVENTSTAIKRAAQALDSANQTGIDNPTTRVHELVKYLQEIKQGM